MSRRAGQAAIGLALLTWTVVGDLPWAGGHASADPTTLARVALAAPGEQARPGGAPAPAANPNEVIAGNLTLRVTPKPWQIDARLGDTAVYRDLAGTPTDTHYGAPGYLRVGATQWAHLTEVVAAEKIPNGLRYSVATTEPGGVPARVEITSAMAGVVRVAITPPPGGPIAWTVTSAASDDTETLLGLGERFDGLSLAGRRLELWAADRREAGYGDATYLPVPWVLSSRGFGFLLDDTRRSAWEMRSQRGDAWAVGVPGANLAYYIIGGAPAQALDRYTALTGRPPAVPDWGFGVVKTLVGGEARVLADARRLRDDGIPVDGLYVYDAEDAEANIGWPHVTFEPVPGGSYPDVRRLTGAIRQLGYRPLGYFSPDFRPERASFQQAARSGYLVRGADGKTWLHPLYGISLIDALNPKAVEWWQKGPLRRALVDLGFDGGMLDLGEALPREASFESGMTGAEAHNAYTVAYIGAAYNALKTYRPDGLFWARSGFTGGQRFHAGTWSGDPIHSWEPVTGLKSIVPAGLGAGLAGYAYFHTEVGGYVDGDLSAASERDLYIRWLELGAFTTMLRDQYGDRHNAPTYIWSDRETVALWRRYASIHQALGPYLRQAGQQAQATGLPLMRHLVLAYPNDPRAWTEEQEFMLGDDLLVAPVVEPGARERRVYLPAGEWRLWWTGQSYQGPADIVVPAPQDQIPVFLRGGANSPLPDPASLGG